MKLCPAERAFLSDLSQTSTQKYKVYRSGWPDFFILYEDGTCEFVEVKGYKDKVRDHQDRLHKAMIKGGLKVTVVRAGKNEVSRPRRRGICPKCNKEVPLRHDERRAISHNPCGYVLEDSKIVSGPADLKTWRQWSREYEMKKAMKETSKP